MKPKGKKTAAKKVVSIKATAKTAERTPDWRRALRTAQAKPGDEKRAALKRAGVSEADLAKAAPVSEILGYADGGVRKIVNAMRLVQGDATIAKFLEKHDAISDRDRKYLSIEAIALAAGLDPRALLGSAMISLQTEAQAIIRVMTTSAHPKIVAARIRYGQMPGGDKDRLALDQALGFLPSPKGPTFIGKAIFGTGKTDMDQQRLNGGDDDDEEPPIVAGSELDMDRIFPPPSRMQEKLNAIRQHLPEPKKLSN